MKYQKIILPGGSGFIGRLLINHFKEQCAQIIVFTRGKSRQQGNVRFEHWEGMLQPKQNELFEGADMVINLTGKSVDCRYTRKNRNEIISSRVNSTRFIGEAIVQCQQPPSIWMNMSSATLYRYSEDKEMGEDGDVGTGFSIDVVQAWESAATSFDLPKTRQVLLRTGIVLGNTGGGFVPLKRLVKCGLGGKSGHGRQFISWIHERDFLRMIDWVIDKKEIVGPLNVTGPNPTPNKNFMQSLRSALSIPIGLPSPSWMLAIGTLLLRTEAELILKSRRVIPQKATETGFSFHYGKLVDAMGELTSVVGE